MAMHRGKRTRGRGSRRGPLRRVGARDPAEDGFDYLECGHRIVASRDRSGRTFPERRRCWKCLSESRRK